jgi:hypothetical protein
MIYAQIPRHVSPSDSAVPCDTCLDYLIDGNQPQPAATVTPGMKFDFDKPDWSLLPMGSVEEVVKVLTRGAAKYERDNWQRVDHAENRYASALMRHMAAHQMGERLDSESGLSHLAHVACNALFLLWFQLNDKG